MRKFRAIKIDYDVYVELVKVRGELMAKKGRNVTFSDVIRLLLKGRRK